MSHEPLVSEHDEQQLSYGKYVAGFVSSVVLTFCAYWIATHVSANRNLLAVILALLAITQFIVQMVLFLHIGEERGTRWKLAAACFMLCVVLILVGGSIWIMNNLNYQMSTRQMLQYMQNETVL